MTTYMDRVKLGASVLDREIPDWLSKIDVSVLTLESTCACVLGQTFGDYGIGSKALGFTETSQHFKNTSVEDAVLANHGFLISDRESDIATSMANALNRGCGLDWADSDEVVMSMYRELTQTWLVYIAERRAAEAAPAERELAMAS